MRHPRSSHDVKGAPPPGICSLIACLVRLSHGKTQPTRRAVEPTLCTPAYPQPRASITMLLETILGSLAHWGYGEGASGKTFSITEHVRRGLCGSGRG